RQHVPPAAEEIAPVGAIALRSDDVDRPRDRLEGIAAARRPGGDARSVGVVEGAALPATEVLARVGLEGGPLVVAMVGGEPRTLGTPKVRVYNPQFDEHGWGSTHTAVEIVTDDMPFLIDSVTMELNRRGYGVHLIIHPVIRVLRDSEDHLTAVMPPTTNTGHG